MNFKFDEKIYNKNLLVNLIEKCNKKNKEKVLNLLVSNNKLLLQLELFTSLKNSFLSRIFNVSSKHVCLNLNRRVVSKQLFFIRNSNRILFFFKKSFLVKFIKIFLIRYNILFLKQKLRFNNKLVLLLNELYSILLENFHEISYYNNITKITLYKFDKGFMEDTLINKKNINLFKALNSMIYNNIIFFNKRNVLLKGDFFNENLTYINLNNKSINNIVSNLDLQKYITYFCLYFKNLSSFNVKNKNKSILQKNFLNAVVFYFFFINIFKKNFHENLFFCKKSNFLLKTYSFIMYNSNFFGKLLKLKYAFILLNESFFKNK